MISVITRVEAGDRPGAARAVRALGEVRVDAAAASPVVAWDDDTGNGVACSLAAVSAGACQVQGTLAGFGERCGNADLVAIIPALQAERGLDSTTASLFTSAVQLGFVVGTLISAFFGLADRFDPRRRFSTWIFQIANNLCRDRGRRRADEHQPEPGGPHGLVAGDVELGEAAAEEAHGMGPRQLVAPPGVPESRRIAARQGPRRSPGSGIPASGGYR